MSAAPAPVRRQALNLPAGSIRAILALTVLAVLWVLAVAKHSQELPRAFFYLLFLMTLILAHYFAAHGKSLGRQVSEKSALGLPAGSVRFLLLFGYLGLTFYLYNNDSKFEFPDSGPFLLLIAVLLTGFMVGYFLTVFMKWVGGGTLPAWFQDIQAWVAILAMIAMTTLIMIYAVINPSVGDDFKVNVEKIEIILSGLVGLYFGART